MRYSTVIFDLDGTLLDTSPGILGCFAKAEEELGMPPLPPEERKWVLGPTLFDSFTIKYGLDTFRAQEAVDCYRKHYAAGGVLNCKPFPGIEALLADLQAGGLCLRVATSKAGPFARQALEHTGLLRYFDKICAPDLHNKKSNKAELVRQAMEGSEGPCLMVGDRRFDIEGAHAQGIDSAFALYGFGDEWEAAACRPSYLLHSADELRPLLLGKGCFLCFEGGDGSGKTTQIHRVKAYLEQKGYAVRLTREPGGTPVSEAVRGILLDPDQSMDPLTEAYLYAAARAEHVRRVLRPALLRGEVVLCDRYLDSSIAYQGYGRGLGEETVRAVNALAVDGCLPDRRYLFLLDDEEAERRASKRSQRDRLELAGEAFRARVGEGYRALAKEEGVCAVPAAGSEEEVFAFLRKDLDRFL